MMWVHLLLVLAPLSYGLICDNPVGIEDGSIPDKNIQASSEYSRFQAAKDARLNNVPKPLSVGAWCAKKDDPQKYIQVDLGSVRKLGYVLIQGRNTTYNQYVSEFRVSVSLLGSIFTPLADPFNPGTPKLFKGNKDMHTVVKVDIRKDPSTPVTARYIRIYVTKFYSNPCLRLELLECPAVVPTCPNGHRLGQDNKTCEDINECSESGLSKCDPYSTKCTNNKGGYTCECKPGYQKSIYSQYRCDDINECQGSDHNCSQTCNNIGGSFRCSCKNGYTLNADGKTCSDIDECAGPNPKARCDSKTTACSNYDGGYKCVCNKGYKRKDSYTCVDKNECTNEEALCSLQSTQCYNIEASYICICKKGYYRKPGQQVTMPYRCLDYDECSHNNGGCSHGCQNLNGTFLCRCPNGYELGKDEYTCQDKNECMNGANGGCEQYCNNTNGSYRCLCRDGFRLTNKFKCTDIDECAEKTAKCDPQSTNCRNNQPLYQCDCKQGYRPISGNSYKCEPLTCAALSQSVGTNISPSTCTQNGAPKLNDVCTFSCAAGYQMPAGKGTTLKCQASGSWTGDAVSCVRKVCPALTAPINGKVWPDFCQTKGNSFGEKCYYRCNDNFNAVGDAARTCQADGTWSTPAKPFSCQAVQPKPTITCPVPVTVKLQTGENTADVSALLDKPKSNVKTITVSPSKYQTTSIFPAGHTVLTYTASNSLNEKVSCKTTVTVLDEEKPKVTGCPMDIYQTVIGRSKQVAWIEPKFTDNVGVTKTTSTKKPGDTFDIGSILVYYHGFDAAGNRATCSFSVTIKKAECPPPATPDNGKLNINEFNGVKYATIRCNSGKQMFWATWGITCNAQSLKWDPVPDCVDYKAITESGCDQGYVKQSGVGAQNICVKCPRGYFYDSSTKTCSKCAIGQFGGSEGSLSCTACPANQGTVTTGSKSCIPKCVPGRESPDGFTSCKACRQGFYEDRYGSTACKPCPNGMATLSIGAKSLSDCGVRPSITEFVIQPNNVTERQPTEIVCKGSGVPLPTFMITKIKPTPDGFGGPVIKAPILDTLGRTVGLRYTISKTTEHDAGAYQCQLHNSFGKTECYRALHIQLIILPPVGR